MRDQYYRINSLSFSPLLGVFVVLTLGFLFNNITRLTNLRTFPPTTTVFAQTATFTPSGLTCNQFCTGGSQCASNYCYLGVCRNPLCASDSTCSCLLGSTPQTITGHVWVDDGNGIEDEGNITDFSDWVVEVYDASNDSLVQTVSVNMGGLYTASVNPDQYYLRFLPKPGYTFTLQDQGADDCLDSDADTNGYTNTLPKTEPNPCLHAGYVPVATPTPPSSNTFQVSGTIWDDADGDGIQNDPPSSNDLSGWTVEVFHPIIDILIDTTITDANGAYTFKNIPEGDNYVRFRIPPTYAGATFSPRFFGGINDCLDSNADVNTGQTDPFYLKGDMTCVDAGIIFPNPTPTPTPPACLINFTSGNVTVTPTVGVDQITLNWVHTFTPAELASIDSVYVTFGTVKSCVDMVNPALANGGYGLSANCLSTLVGDPVELSKTTTIFTKTGLTENTTYYFNVIYGEEPIIISPV